MSPTCVIIGRVVEGLTDTRVADVEVALSGMSEPYFGLNAMTDTEGNFVFFNVPAGTYGLRATKHGYWFGEYGQRRGSGAPRRLLLAEGQRVAGVTVPLWKFSAISGTVRDDVGEPVVGVAMQAMVLAQRAGRLLAFNTSSTIGRTDDRGVYRIANLLAGEYLLALPTLEMSSLLPEGLTAAEAAVSLAAAEERRALDTSLASSRVYRVSGRLIGGGTGGIKVDLVRPDERYVTDVVVQQMNTRADGSFGFTGVPSGSYAVRVIASSRAAGGGEAFAAAGAPPSRVVPSADTNGRWAMVPFVVADGNVDDVAVVLRAGARINGRLVFEGGSAPAATELGRMFGVISRADGRITAQLTSERMAPDAEGRFGSGALPSGRYFVRFPGQFIPPGWALSGVTLLGRDVLDEPLKLDGEDVENLVVTLTDKISELRGSVQTSSDDPDLDASVLVFPADRRLWLDFGADSPRVRSTRVNDAGTYSLKGLPPGAYLVVAIDDAIAVNWQTQAMFERLAPVANRLTVAVGAIQTVNLQTKVIR